MATYICQICSRRYRNRAELNSHLTRSHRQSATDTFAARGASSTPCDVQLEPAINHQDGTDAIENSLHSFGVPVEGNSWIGSSDRQLFGSMQSCSVADDTKMFFEAFEDKCSPLYPEPIVLNPPFESLHSSVKRLVRRCIKRKLSGSECVEEYIFAVSLQEHLHPSMQCISNTFRSGTQFRDYMESFRRYCVQQEGWRKCFINTDGGLNDTGVYRSVWDLFLKELQSAGGVENLQRFQEREKDGDRVFSAPWDSNSMRDLELELRAEGREGAKIAAIEVYCDGTALSTSGSQSAHNLRVRFTNLKGKSTDWHEVGITPCLKQRDDSRVRSKGDARKERMELFQRYLYLVFRREIAYSSVGYIHENTIILPRILLIVCDQPQERQFVCLKGADSYCDCTFCEIPFKIPARRVASGVSERPNKRRRICNDGGDGNCQPQSAESGSEAEQVISEPSHDAITGQSLLALHTEGVKAKERDVTETVKAQLSVAISKQRSRNGTQVAQDSAVRAEVARARKYLTSKSAHPFPPALACFHGLGSAPFNLYESCGFDKLHAYDLGLLRMIPDLVCKKFEDRTLTGMPMSQAIQVANQRLIDLPRCTRLPRISVFRASSTELQSGMTGQVRREFCPFIWIALIGLNRTVTPDDDALVQASLMLSAAHVSMLGVNKPASAAMRTAQDIEALQRTCREAGKLLLSALNIPVNTKLHRVMHHVSDYLFKFGCMRRSSTDENEVMHKKTKKAYKSTNKKLSQLGPQLLKSRLELDESSGPDEIDGGSEPSAEEKLLLTRNKVLFGDNEPKDNRSSSDVEREITNSTQHVTSHAVEENRAPLLPSLQDLYDVNQVIELSSTPKEADEKICTIHSAVTFEHTWQRKKSVQIEASFPWADNLKVRQVVYAGESVFGSRNRRDSIVYKQGGQVRRGILQAVYEHRKRKLRYVLVRAIEETSGQPGNLKVIEKFGHQRYKYSVESGRVVMHFLPVESIVRAVIVVPDMYELCSRQGSDHRMTDLDETKEGLILQRFFEFHTYKFTSLPAQIC